jgi:hypothetical protein
MDAPIDSVNNGKRGSAQFVVEAAREKSADDRLAMGLAFQSPSGWRPRRSVLCERLVQPFDDIPALPQGTQALLGVWG